MLKTENGKPNIYFYITWFLQGVACIPIAWGATWVILMVGNQWLGDTIMVAGQRHITEDYLAGLVLIPMIGLIAGLLQFLVLRQVLPRMGWWVAATFAGALAAYGFLSLVLWTAPERLGGKTMFLAVTLVSLAGGLNGLCQWLVIRKKIQRTGWWILGVAAVWVLIFWLTDTTISNYWDVAAVSVLPPLVTGLLLWLLFQQQGQAVPVEIPIAASPD